MRRHSQHPQSAADAEFMEEEARGLYSDRLGRKLISYYYNQRISDKSALLGDIEFDRFADDAIVELHGCRTGMGLSGWLPVPVTLFTFVEVEVSVDNFAENLSEDLPDEALVIAHTERSSPLPGTNDYRHGLRKVYQNGRVVFETRKRGAITHNDIPK